MVWGTRREILRQGSFLYGISPWDPLAVAVVACSLLGIGLISSWVPARRAARVEPAICLRQP